MKTILHILTLLAAQFVCVPIAYIVCISLTVAWTMMLWATGVGVVVFFITLQVPMFLLALPVKLQLWINDEISE